ncbi:PAS domain S-box protein [Methanoculleus sp.]|uniref:PAS domain S-box protein n=1 Tax=Methanoculleus sp. TaxID=90427 RepID=UPI001BD376FE|nr:PAS domain S-box protein [Methanoculleus sp.]
MHFADITYPEDLSEDMALAASLVAGEIESYRLENRYVRKDGRILWGMLTTSLVRNAEGGPQFLIGMIENITERKQAEEALILAKDYNRGLIEASIDPLATIDAEGRITDVNAATEKATGYARDELIGTDFSDYFTDPDRAQAGYRQTFVDGEVRDYPLEIRHRDGWMTPVLYNTAVYRDGRGRVAGIFAAARDITERKRAELALQESEEQFRALLDATPDATVLIDREGTILALNETMAARSGGSIEDLRGTCVYDLFPPDLAASRKKWADEAFSSARPIRMTDEYEGRIFDHILFPIKGANGQVRRLAVISSDVTERKQVERIRQEAYDRIEQNIEQFAILADHVHQPLQVILGTAALLDEGTATERIQKQVERINAIVKQLDRGWIESRKIREFLRRHEAA